MSNSPDPQTWVFPPLGAPDPPSGAAAAFGPVAKGDKIDLVWAPATEKPEIALICSNDSTTYTISTNHASPFSYTFEQSLGDGKDDETYICHFFFPGTQVGNTVTFQYLDTPAESPDTWQQDSQLQSALSGGAATTSAGSSAPTTVTKTVSAGTFITVSQPSTTFVAIATGGPAQGDSSQPSATNSNTGSGLSVGAGVGIGIGAAVAFCGLLFLGYFIYRRLRREKRKGPLPVPQQSDSAYAAQSSKGPSMRQQPNTLSTEVQPGPRGNQPRPYGPQGLHEMST